MDRETALRWLYLDNARNAWPPSTGLDVLTVHRLTAWAKEHKYVRGGKLTPAGEAAYLLLDRGAPCESATS